MTGFGKAIITFYNTKINITIRSLNSKQFDFSSRTPSKYKEKEIELRNIISKELFRGKIDLSISVEENSENLNQKELFDDLLFSKALESIQEKLNKYQLAPPQDLFSIIMRMPGVINYTEKDASTELHEEEWAEVKKGIYIAIEELKLFRTQEGAMLSNIFQSNIADIRHLLTKIEAYENKRIELIRFRLEENLRHITIQEYDKHRLEQELIYYIEKLDINEEKNRLLNHLDFFLETMNKETFPGKKLGFIAQEIGREINTLGSKSNQADMQKIVVEMKDRLEQIKEQILNTL